MSITRRLFLRNSATASAFSFAGLSPVLASSVESDENAALLAMAPRCAELQGACIMADAERLAARERYDLLKPKMPKGMAFEYNERVPDVIRFCTEVERDGEYEVNRRNDQPPRNVVSSYAIALQTPAVKFPLSKDDQSRLLFLRRTYRMALRYERGCEKARVASGLNDAAGAMYGLYTDVYAYAKAVCELDAKTWTGIAIKARACELAKEWGYKDGGMNADRMSGTHIVPNILALSEGRP